MGITFSVYHIFYMFSRSLARRVPALPSPPHCEILPLSISSPPKISKSLPLSSLEKAVPAGSIYGLSASALFELTEFCLSLVKDERSPTPDNRPTKEEFHAMRAQIARSLNSPFPPSAPPVLLALPTDAHAGLLGMTDIGPLEREGALRETESIRIFIKPNMPRTSFAWTLAHEYSHVNIRVMQLLLGSLLYSHEGVDIRTPEKQKIEGLCELLALLCVADMARDEPDVYSTSFLAGRLALAMHDREASDEACNDAAKIYTTTNEVVSHVYSVGLCVAFYALRDATKRGLDLTEFSKYFLSTEFNAKWAADEPLPECVTLVTMNRSKEQGIPEEKEGEPRKMPTELSMDDTRRKRLERLQGHIQAKEATAKAEAEPRDADVAAKSQDERKIVLTAT